MKITEIGFVSNTIKEPTHVDEFKNIESILKIKKEYSDGLYRLDESEYIMIAFVFHKNNKNVELKQTDRYGEYKGVFATRSPHRPTSLGISIVKVLEYNGNEIRVMGLDAIDGTPIIDVKPFADYFDCPEKKNTPEINVSDLKDPRKKINDKLAAGDRKGLLKDAGKLHGHYCPGLALGIQLAVGGMHEIRRITDGIMENLIAITEMNNCAVDGIQYVTGCTLGNNALLFEDIGKNALTLAVRGGKAVRVTVKENWSENANINPAYTKLFEKVVKDRNATEEELVEFRKFSKKTSYDVVSANPSSILNVEEVTYDLPARAPIHPDFNCAKCGEKTMGSRKIVNNNQDLCLKCASEGYYRLTGHGIEFYKE